LGKSKTFKKAIENLTEIKASLANGTITDHNALVSLNESLLAILLEE
jgi:hypothetical protein